MDIVSLMDFKVDSVSLMNFKVDMVFLMDFKVDVVFLMDIQMRVEDTGGDEIQITEPWRPKAKFFLKTFSSTFPHGLSNIWRMLGMKFRSQNLGFPRDSNASNLHNLHTHGNTN